MKRYKYKKVDAFTSNGSKGNPAAFMVLDENNFNDSDYLEVAKSHAGFICEFIFVNESNKAQLKLTYYSSECEIDFCGHGTIATMYELIKNDKNLISQKEIKFETNRKGILTAYNHIQDEDAVYISAPAPIFYDNKISEEEIAKTLGLETDSISKDFPVSIINAGLKTLIVPIKNLKTEISVYPDLETLKQFVIENKIDIILI